MWGANKILKKTVPLLFGCEKFIQTEPDGQADPGACRECKPGSITCAMRQKEGRMHSWEKVSIDYSKFSRSIDETNQETIFSEVKAYAFG